MTGRPRTLYEKIWDAHVVARRDDGTCLIYIDRHLVHEVTSPQAFAGLRDNGRKVRRPDLTLAVDSGDADAAGAQAADIAPGSLPGTGPSTRGGRVWPRLAGLFALLWLAASGGAWDRLRLESAVR